MNTSTEYKNVVKSEDRKFYSGAEITLLDSTILTLDNTNIISLKVEDATSQDNTFSIGSAIINKLTLTINNLDETYSEYDFTGAIIRPTVGLQLSSTIETLSKGVFVADDPKAVGSIITLTALDNMVKFDKPFSGVTQAFPCTAQVLLNIVCTYCQVSLATSTFLNDDYVITARPLDEATSCREIISWIAQLSGNFARCNTSGQLELKWYDFGVFEGTILDGGYFDETEEASYQSGDNADGGNFTDYTSGNTIDGGLFSDMSRYHHLYSLGSLSIAIDDVIITGIRVTDGAETPNTALFGTEGYIISLSGNDLIQSLADATTIANSVGAKLVGMKFRPLSTSVLSDPSIEAGDVAYVTDRKQNTYQILITNTTYSVGKSQSIKCDAESPSRNSSTRYSAETKIIVKARETAQAKLDAYDLMVQQLSNLISHSFGFYSTEEILPDGSKIYYKHDKPTRAESTKIWKETIDAFAVSTNGGVTWNAGFDVNGNAVFNVLSAIGINADWIRLGKLLSNDGATLIDMAYGVANEDNFGESENVQNGFPLNIPFYIGDTVSKINKAILQFTQKPFRTYSTTASSGGSSSVTSVSGGGQSITSDDGDMYSSFTKYTDIETADGMHHIHHFSVASDELPHTHGVTVSSHTHSVSVPSHTHTLNFGIQEQAITNNAITIYVDGTLRATTSDLQGVIDLTAYITTVGWHAIELRSTTLKRISAQINIKSYIRS